MQCDYRLLSFLLSLSAVRSFNNNKQFTMLIIGRENTQKKKKMLFVAQTKRQKPEKHQNYRESRFWLRLSIFNCEKFHGKLKKTFKSKQKTSMRGPNKLVTHVANLLNLSNLNLLMICKI